VTGAAGPPSAVDRETQLRETRAAFDSVAADYDGARGNNELIQDMRQEMWRWLDTIFPQPSRLLDLGCGTGLDAVREAELGHRVLATDWSERMVARTRERAAASGLAARVDARLIGAHELDRLEVSEPFDGAYSNLGPLNCVADLDPVARECARLVRPGGHLLFTVIGRVCPWEIAHYAIRGRGARIAVRFARGTVPVSMNGRTIWTRYHTPRSFFAPFATGFELRHFRGLCVFAPPPYLTGVRDRAPRLYDALWRLDRRVAGWPLLRTLGDHFLILMRRRAAGPGHAREQPAHF
jgi:SAM-dependent methyltransferase